MLKTRFIFLKAILKLLIDIFDKDKFSCNNHKIKNLHTSFILQKFTKISFLYFIKLVYLSNCFLLF